MHGCRLTSFASWSISLKFDFQSLFCVFLSFSFSFHRSLGFWSLCNLISLCRFNLVGLWIVVVCHFISHSVSVFFTSLSLCCVLWFFCVVLQTRNHLTISTCSINDPNNWLWPEHLVDNGVYCPFTWSSLVRCWVDSKPNPTCWHPNCIRIVPCPLFVFVLPSLMDTSNLC